MIEIRGLSHSFGAKLVLNNIDLNIEDGTVLGIVGINGAGKSTFLRLLSGVYDSKGCVLYNGNSKYISIDKIYTVDYTNGATVFNGEGEITGAISLLSSNINTLNNTH